MAENHEQVTDAKTKDIPNGHTNGKMQGIPNGHSLDHTLSPEEDSENDEIRSNDPLVKTTPLHNTLPAAVELDEVVISDPLRSPSHKEDLSSPGEGNPIVDTTDSTKTGPNYFVVYMSPT